MMNDEPIRTCRSTPLTAWFDRLTTLSNVEGLSLSKGSLKPDFWRKVGCVKIALVRAVWPRPWRFWRRWL